MLTFDICQEEQDKAQKKKREEQVVRKSYTRLFSGQNKIKYYSKFKNKFTNVELV